MATEWYLRSGPTVTGPLTTDQLKAMGKAGRVVEGMEVSNDADGPWHRASAVNGLVVIPAALAASAVRPQAGPRNTTVVVESPVPTHVTVEKTRKSIKIQRLIALMMILTGATLTIVGVLAAENEPQPSPVVSGIGSLITVGGIGWRIVLRALTWWHHD